MRGRHWSRGPFCGRHLDLRREPLTGGRPRRRLCRTGRYGRSASSRQPWSTSRSPRCGRQACRRERRFRAARRLRAGGTLSARGQDTDRSGLSARRCHCAHGRSANAARNAEIPPTIRNADETGRAGEERCRTRNRGLARPSAERPPHYGHGCKPPQSVFFQEVDSGLTIPMPFIPPARLGRRPAAARPPWNGGVRTYVAP
jgi:hypothetical protein